MIRDNANGVDGTILIENNLCTRRQIVFIKVFLGYPLTYIHIQVIFLRLIYS
jgi:hypothetical protein